MQSDDLKAKTHPHLRGGGGVGGGVGVGVGVKPAPKAELTAVDFARLENMTIGGGDHLNKNSAPAGLQHPSHSLAPGPRNVAHSPQATRIAPGGGATAANQPYDLAAAQNGVRLLAALAAGPQLGAPGMPHPTFAGAGRVGGAATAAPPPPQPLAFPGHPLGMPLGLPTMPLSPPSGPYGFPAALSAGHPPLYDFAALQQQHLIELAAAQQAQVQALTPGIGGPANAARPSPSDVNAAALALLQQGIVPPGAAAAAAAFGAPFPGAFPGAGSPYYPSPTDNQYNPDFVAAMARALPQYAAAVAAAAAAQAQYPGVDLNTVAALNLATGDAARNAGGPSANNRKLGLYKTELCRSWEEKGTCRYGPKCQFAHGEEELRKVQRHPKYKTEICRTFWVSGSCPYGKRCCFIHTELPGPNAPGGAAGSPDGAPATNGTSSTSAVPTTPTPNASTTDGANAPERTPSANSSVNAADGSEQQQTSLLARINAKRKEEETGNGATPSPAISVGRPGLSGLRVDTSALDPTGPLKQNKSAYPTFASNQTIPTVDSALNEAPPATAGPEFGRQRLELLGLAKAAAGGGAHTRSLSNTDGVARAVSNAGSLAPLVSGGTPDSATAPVGVPTPPPPAAAHGHSRSTSGSHWSSTRGGAAAPTGQPHLTALSAFPRDDERSPWGQAATAAPTGRYPNRAWAS